MAKGKLRHIAMSVKDPWKTAEFYKAAFDMEVVGETDSDIAEGVFLSDGVINLALLAFKSDEMAQGTGKDFVGLHHIGFWVDHQVGAGEQAMANGATWIMGDPNNKGGYEVKYTDPNGIIFDIAEDGWGGSQKNPGQPDNVVCPNTRKFLPQFAERRERARAERAAQRA
jgi:catechol 2,3-dioxygenase-like lactoylglutathione lyase family enzyme